MEGIKWSWLQERLREKKVNEIEVEGMLVVREKGSKKATRYSNRYSL